MLALLTPHNPFHVLIQLLKQQSWKGPKVSEVLALRVNEACTKKALDSKLKEIEAKYKAPENCDFLCVPKVNLEFWFELARQARTKDLALQEAQRGITKGVQPVIELVEKILNAQKTKSELKPDSFITPLVEAITLLCNASFRLSLVRRETMSEFVNPSYRSLCSKNTPPGKWLFGDELPKHIKEIVEVNKMANKLGPSQTSPGTRRGDRRNTSGRGSSFNQGQGRKVYFLGSRNRSNTTHNRWDPKSNPHSLTAAKQHSSL